jgi:thiamine kinase-like enzyme
VSAGVVQLGDLAWAFAHIPLLSGCAAGDFHIAELPGYTNRNYRLRNAAQDWVLRMPRPLTDHLIDRAAEAHNQTLAHRLGLAPQVAWRNDAGVTLTPTLAEGRNLHAADLKCDSLLATIVEPFQRLHRSALRFNGGIDLRGTLQQHYELLQPGQRACFATRLIQAERVLSLLEKHEPEPVPAHRDPVPGNLLLDGKRLWLIDWEYSAMASPYWDLAILCNEGDLDLAQSRRLLRAYCVDGPAMKESVLFDYRGLLKLLNDCWMAALVDS